MTHTPLSTKLVMMALVLAMPASAAHAREQIRIVGSATVYPFVTAAAEQFGLGEKFPTPIVESTGTGGGFKLFCDGVGDNKPDMNNASRRISGSEVKQCEKNGITDVLEVPLGYDGIVLVAKRGTTPINVTKKQILTALARELPNGKGEWVKNPNQTWRDVDASLPPIAISIYGPPPTSGTRDAFAELVMEAGCKAYPEFAVRYPDSKERNKKCHLMREDEKYIEYGDDGNVLVQKVTANDRALGILGFSFYEENKEQVQASVIEGVAPDAASITNGRYSMSRGLYIYVKRQHIGVIPGIAAFLRELTSENAVGEEGYITVKGLLPLPENERRQVNANIKALGK